jgi:hypothetical protein
MAYDDLPQGETLSELLQRLPVETPDTITVEGISLPDDEEPIPMTATSLYLNTGDKRWLDSLFVDESRDQFSNRWRLSSVDPTVDEPRLSSQAAQKFLDTFIVSDSLLYALKSLVWACNAYRLNKDQFEKIRHWINIVRHEIYKREATISAQREAESSVQKDERLIALYVVQEQLELDGLRRNHKRLAR